MGGSILAGGGADGAEAGAGATGSGGGAAAMGGGGSAGLAVPPEGGC
jgi:hypothetical protein